VSAVIAAQNGGVNGNTLKQICLSAFRWNRNLPGVFGQACFRFEMRAELSAGGCEIISDDIYSEVNFHFHIRSAVKTGNIYLLEGTVIASCKPDLVGKLVVIRSESLGDDNSNLSLTVGSIK
jgi:hypothetical protein